MRKIQTVGTVGEFLNHYDRKEEQRKNFQKTAAAVGGIVITTMPKIALAATANSTFGNVHGMVMNAFDTGVVFVIIFAGGSWALGNKTKAMEILLGVSVGYIIARHAVDIRNFLQGI